MLQPGQIVDNYRLDELIHRGRGTLVFAATDLALRRRVAFKVLAGASASDPGARDRFVREAQTAAALDANPHIVTVYRWGQVEDSLYFVTEFVVGISMEELVERQPGGEGLNAGEALDLLRQIAGAVDFAHRRGVVHRDIKSANIMVRMTETPLSAYLVDFGITKIGDEAPDAPTQVGTPDYVAPEVIAGDGADWRADIYSLACTAFEMLSGAPPYADAPHDAAKLAAHLGAPIPEITALRPALPKGFDGVFRRALAKAPEDRYGSCQEFVDALAAELPRVAREYARPETAVDREPPPTLTELVVPARRRWPWLVVTAAFVAGAVVLAWILTAGLRNPGVDVGIGRNVALPTTTTTTTSTTSTTTTSTTSTTTTTTPPPPTGPFGDVVGQPVEPPGQGSPASNFALALQSRVFDVATIAAPGSPAAYYAEWARLVGAADPAEPVVATLGGYLVTADTRVELKDFEFDVDGLPITFTECVEDSCRALTDSNGGLVVYPACHAGGEGCVTLTSASGRVAAVRVMQVLLRAPRYSVMFRLEPPVPAAPVGTEPPPTSPPVPQVQTITNAQRSARFLANGSYVVVSFPRYPTAGTVETLSITYADGTTDQLQVRF